MNLEQDQMKTDVEGLEVNGVDVKVGSEVDALATPIPLIRTI